MKSTEEYWKSIGYTKPTAKSMAVLDAAIEYAEGHPKPGGFYPWHVKLTDIATKKLNLDNPFICTATELHKIAEQWNFEKNKK